MWRRSPATPGPSSLKQVNVVREAWTEQQGYDPRTKPNGPADHWGLSEDSSPKREVRGQAYAPDADVEAHSIDHDREFWDIFEDIRTIGRGNFAKVKEVEHRETGEVFAVKALDKDPDCNAMEDLVREVQILSVLRHPNIIRLYAAYESPKRLFLVMEYADGGELMQRLGVGGGTYSEEMVRRLVRTLCSAVGFMHKSNIAHRDLKPENVLLAGDPNNPTVKIVDLGLSRAFENSQMMRTVCGTHKYLAPEMIDCDRGERRGYDKAVDMWGIGMLAFIMLYGSNPFTKDASTQSQVHAAISRCDLVFPNSNVTDEAKAFVQRLLCRTPGERMTADQALDHDWLTELDPYDGGVGERSFKTRSQQLVVAETPRAAGAPAAERPVHARLFEWNAQRFLSRAVKSTHRRLSTGAVSEEKSATSSSNSSQPRLEIPARAAAPAAVAAAPSSRFTRRPSKLGVFQSPMGL